MIGRDEIEAKATDFGIHIANVERDYVFGWLLFGIYGSHLRDQLTLKGGNCLRKAYFPTTRFSNDLDFSTSQGIDPPILVAELNAICKSIESISGIEFVTERTRANEKTTADQDAKLYEARVYFKDFYGNADSITISVRLDIAAFDRLYLPIQDRYLVHPYSDAPDCRATIRCMKLEELLAVKLKCLLQRRHLADLFDLVYAVFINRELAVNRAEILQNFLQRTVFQGSPGTAKTLLLELPLEMFRSVWKKYIVCPVQTLFDFDAALAGFREVIEAVFGQAVPGRYGGMAFFPSGLRNPIMEAAANQVLVEIDYHGVRRKVEPYALVFKRRRDGLAREYFYGYDQTGGRSTGPGIKMFVHTDIDHLRVTEEEYQPRYPISLSRTGELSDRSYFGTGFGRARGRLRRRAIAGARWVYTVQCTYCGRRFPRLKPKNTIRQHQDAYGNGCYGRSGTIVEREYRCGA